MKEFSPALRSQVTYTLVRSLIFLAFFWAIILLFFIESVALFAAVVILYIGLQAQRIQTTSFTIHNGKLIYRRYFTPWQNTEIDINRIARIRLIHSATILQRYIPSLEFEYESDTELGYVMRERRRQRNKFWHWGAGKLQNEKNYLRHKQIPGWETPEIVRLLASLYQENPSIVMPTEYAELVEAYDNPDAYKAAVDRKIKKDGIVNQGIAGLFLLGIVGMILLMSYTPEDGFDLLRFPKAMLSHYVEFFDSL